MKRELESNIESNVRENMDADTYTDE